MPGLLDLPAELIEQIYDVYYRATDHDDRAQLGYLRLTCHYVEKSTRRHFFRYQCWYIRVSTIDDDSIRRFCAMTMTPDFAKAVKSISLFACNDSTTELENKSLRPELHTSDSTYDSGPSDKLRSMVPAALLRHENSLIKALTAFENVRSLLIRDLISGHLPNKHCDTLKTLTLTWVELRDGSAEEFRGFLESLQKFLKLENLYLDSLWLDDRCVQFPWAYAASGKDIDDEDDYVLVEVTQEVILAGVENVHEGLMLMAQCMKVVQG